MSNHLTKTLLVMKLTLCLLTVALVQVHASGLSQTVTFSGRDVPLEKVFFIVEQQTGFVFFYDASLLKEAKPVSVDAEKMPVDDFLRTVFAEQPLEFIIKKQSISVQQKVPRLSRDYLNAIDTAAPGVHDYTLRGVVYGEEDAPLSDVTIQLERTGKGTISKASGEFTIHNVGIGDVLIMSYVGYGVQKLRISKLQFTEVKMIPSVSVLDQVVIQGYGVTSNRFTTGNIATVSAKEIERQPVANPLQALQGKVPGLIITQKSGGRSAPINVELRGRSSINPSASSTPLYILDGVPLNVLTLFSGSTQVTSDATGFNQSGFPGPLGGQSPLYSLSPDEIESITVLKDADATAVYGSRGGNGVILINTKKGKPGKTKIELAVDKGSSFTTSYYEMLNTPQYLAMRKEALRNDGLPADEYNAYDLLVWDTTNYTDWQRMFWGKPASVLEAKINASGGDKMTTYRISGGYDLYKALNNFSGEDQRFRNQINISHKSLNNKLNISFTNLFSYTRSTIIGLTGSTLLPPNAPSIFNNQDEFNWEGWRPANFNFGNLKETYDAKTTLINTRISFTYRITKGLSFSNSFGYSQNFQRQMQIFPISAKDPTTNPTGSAVSGNSNASRLIVEPQLEYKKFLFGGDLHALVGTSYQHSEQAGGIAQGFGFINDNLIRSIGSAPSQSATNIEGQYKYAAIFGRLTYHFSRKYLLNLSGRRDGSSRFAEGNNWGNFYSAGAGYILSEESYFKRSLPFINFAKLRISYGLVGSDNISDYQYLTRWTGLANGITYQNNTAFISTQHANPSLKWQSDKKLETGVEMSFFKDRFNLGISWYQNTSGNQLLSFRLPSATGFEVVTANFPATVRNRGVEVTGGVKIIRNKSVDWQLNVNAGANKNILLSYPNLERSPYAFLYTVGQPLNIKKVLQYTGVDPQTGQYTFEDRVKDGEFDTNPTSATSDLVVKDLSVKCDGGFGNDIRFKNIELSMFFQFRIGDGRNAFYTGGPPGGIQNISAESFNKRWQKPGDQAEFARLTTLGESSDSYFFTSTGLYSNASFIRLNNLSLSYIFSTPISTSIGFKDLRVYAQGQNLLLITGYKGSDPETQAFGQLPPLTTVTFGIKASF